MINEKNIDLRFSNETLIYYIIILKSFCLGIYISFSSFFFVIRFLRRNFFYFQNILFITKRSKVKFHLCIYDIKGLKKSELKCKSSSNKMKRTKNIKEK